MPQSSSSSRRVRAAAEAGHLGFLVQCAPGLERILWQELHELTPAARRTGTAVLPRRNGLVFVATDDVEALLASRIAEDIFVVLARGPVLAGSDGLADVEALAARCSGLAAALQEHAQLHGGRGHHPVSTFRVVVRAAGDRAYRRIDVQHRVAVILGGKLGKRWRSVTDTGQVEFWVTLLGGEAVLALRLTGAEQRHREKTAHIPGSLRPSVAAALVRLSAPRDDDVVLDPFCGAGTILLERAARARHRLLIGSDLDSVALAAAEANIGSRHKPLQLQQWDATALPLDDESVDAVITNLPFGIKVGSVTGNRTLYPRFVAEAQRLLTPGGRLVALTSTAALLLPLLVEPHWVAVRSHGFEVQGRLATAVVAVRV